MGQTLKHPTRLGEHRARGFTLPEPKLEEVSLLSKQTACFHDINYVYFFKKHEEKIQISKKGINHT